MPRPPLDKFKGKLVEIRANGLLYRGILREVTETKVTLQRETSYTSIPMDRIASIVDPSAPKPRLAPRYVDPSFYADETPAPKQPATAKPKKES